MRYCIILQFDINRVEKVNWRAIFIPISFFFIFYFFFHVYMTTLLQLGVFDIRHISVHYQT